MNNMNNMNVNSSFQSSGGFESIANSTTNNDLNTSNVMNMNMTNNNLEPASGSHQTPCGVSAFTFNGSTTSDVGASNSIELIEKKENDEGSKQ